MTHSYLTLISSAIITYDLLFRMLVPLTYKSWCFTLVATVTCRNYPPIPHKIYNLVKLLYSFQCILIYFPNSINFTQGIRILLLDNLNFSMISSIFLRLWLDLPIFLYYNSIFALESAQSATDARYIFFNLSNVFNLNKERESWPESDLNSPFPSPNSN